MQIDKTKTINGYKLWDYGYGAFLPLKKICRQLSADSAVLLKNKNRVLPFSSGERLAVFGRIQQHYCKSGHGSGGNVRAAYIPTFLEALQNETDFSLDDELLALYADFVKENPFDNGNGWATEPFCQKEMPLTEEVVAAAAKRNSAALILLGRASGEDKDNKNEKGSFLLNDEEENMLCLVSRHFERVAVIINSGNVMDVSFIEKYDVPAAMYVWQGGETGALAVADLLSGRVSPSGKLPDTQAYSFSDYPSSENFDGDRENLYCEDIYVGYRYFETFAPERVIYPFGFGLSYTDFKISYDSKIEGDTVTVAATVKNVGDCDGKQVVQIYYEAPQGRLGNPLRQLIAFKKTSLLKPQESETLTLSFSLSDMASYNDEPDGKNAFCYILLEGEYKIYAGTDCRENECVLSYKNPSERVIKQLRQALAPVKDFTRIAAAEKDGKIVMERRAVPKRQYSLKERVNENIPAEIAYTGDRGIRLLDVCDGKNTLEEFIAQMGVKELCEIVCGEGMCSWKVPRGGTGAAMGGVTPSLSKLGLPVVCLTDGPAGLRFDGEATSIPIGTALAATFDTEAVYTMASLLGIEIFANDVDILLGCGLNIHRSPLCGRNFEYFSEDPLVSGLFASAMQRGISRSGANVTLKHFAGNGQERNRRVCDTVVSERALREIYLKGFEIAVRAGADVIMTSYNPINSNWAATNYDLTRVILRDEWGFKGFVMSDWWAELNFDGGAPTRDQFASMVKAGNDIYMVCLDAASHFHDLTKKLNESFITVSELQTAAANILRYIMGCPSFIKFVDGGCAKKDVVINDSWMKETLYKENVLSGEALCFFVDKKKTVSVEISYECTADSLAQVPIELETDGEPRCTILTPGTNGEIVTEKRFFVMWERDWKLTATFGNNVKVHSIRIKQ